VALIVGGRVDIDFDQACVGGAEILPHPFCAYEDFRVLVFGHFFSFAVLLSMRNLVTRK